jgi:MAE_28990/MAE_18760-like HEPN
VLDDDLAWRKKELTLLLSQVELKSRGEPFRIAATRSGIALLYAHWEGFIKAAAGHYLEFVSMKQPEFQKVQDGIATLAWIKLTQYQPQIVKASRLASITSFFRSSVGKKIPYLDGKCIDTESNLSSTVFKEIVWCLGLDYSKFEGKEKLIDEKLLAKRNFVAHGHYPILDPDDFPVLHSEVIGMLVKFNDQLQNAAVRAQYLIGGA